VILINLLPHREVRRQERQRLFMVGLGLAAMAGMVLVMFWFAGVEQFIAVQEGRNLRLDGENAKLDRKIKEIATLREEIDALKARQLAVESLQTDRNVPVQLLNELASKTPDGVYLTGVKQGDFRAGEALVSLDGIAESNERISEFIRKLQPDPSGASGWLEYMELVEIKAVQPLPVQSQARGGHQAKQFGFSMRLKLRRPEPKKTVPAPKFGASVPK